MAWIWDFPAEITTTDPPNHRLLPSGLAQRRPHGPCAKSPPLLVRCLKSAILILLLCEVSTKESALGSGMQVVDPLLAPDGGNGDRLGWSVTVDGDIAAVSSPRSGSGGVYLYQRFSGRAWGV